MPGPKLPKVLCVDDEPRVLEGIALHLRRHYEVHLAWSGREALQRLKEIGGAAVVVSDMRMPGMDGAALLRQIRQDYPLTSRILLTGDSSRDSAVQAVNEGQIFRFLTKPCPPERLKTAVEAGVDHYRLLNAERVMMQETLIGCIQALVDVLAITNPIAFGRTHRVKALAMDLAEHLGWTNYWQLEAAAMLSQIGYIALPIAIVEKLYRGETLTPDERTLADKVPATATKLLENIPRLEPVLQILGAIGSTDEEWRKLGSGTVGFGSRILAMVLEYDSLLVQGNTIGESIQALRSRPGRYEEASIAAFAERVGSRSDSLQVDELPLRSVTAGMVFVHDLRSADGSSLVPANFAVTEAFLQKMQHFEPVILDTQVKMLVPAQIS